MLAGYIALKIFVVFNPHAKRNKKRPGLPSKLEAILGPSAVVRSSRSIEGIDEIAREALAEECDVLAVCGGDGTLHHTLSRFHQVYGEHLLPKVLTLGGGTMNMVCHSIKVTGPSEGIAYRFRDTLDKSKQNGKGPNIRTVERDTLQIGERLSFIFGLGLVSNFLDAYYEGGTTGPVKAALVVQRAVASVMKRGEFARELFSPWAGKVVIDGRDVPYEEHTAVLVQTIENLGIGFKPMYRAFEKRRHFHMLDTCLTPVQVVKNIHKVFLGSPIQSPQMTDVIGTRIEITPKEDCRYTMDGDMYTCTDTLTVEVGPRIEFLIV